MVDEMIAEARALVQKAGIRCDQEGRCFSDLKIWLGASSHDCEIIGLAQNCQHVFQELGATVRASKEFGSVVMRQIDESDVILMFAATPGVSARTLEVCFLSDRERNNNREKLRIYMPKPFAGGFIHNRFVSYGAKRIELFDQWEFSGSKRSLLLKCVYDICDATYNKQRQEMLRGREYAPTIGIVTALPVELKAVSDTLSQIRTDTRREREGPYQEYIHGMISCRHGGEHKVVVALAGKGNNKAAVLASSLMERYSSIQDIFMVGVAAGVPCVEDANQHVRLGDIVVCDEVGVIQYDMVKRSTRRIEYTPPPRPPDHAWITRVENYIATMSDQPRYLSYLDDILAKHNIRRPRTAPLRDCPWTESVKAVRQPLAPGHDPARPRIHRGPIASANTVLKSACIREALKKRFKAKAVEMEGSGIAEATWQYGKGYFIIRGICDFANDDKNKRWQPYAAAAAAAFARGLIETMPLISMPLR